MRKNILGFTLIELLTVIAIIGILSTIVVVAVNPARQMAKARDAQRQTDLIAILSAVLQYSSEHSGDLPGTTGFPTTATCIGTAAPCFDLAGAGDTNGQTIIPTYMAAMPHDPKLVATGVAGTDADTGYSIYVDTNNRLHASAVGEITTPITADR